jgi:HAMP domain-containing protein
MFAKFRFTTIQSKAIAVFTMVFLVSCSGLIASQAISERQHTIDLFLEDKMVETNLIASSMAGALRWKKQQVFDETYVRTGLATVKNLMNVSAIKGDGTVIFDRGNTDTGMDFAKILDGSVPLADTPAYRIEDGYVIVSAPSIYQSAKREKHLTVGHIVLFWDISGLENLLARTVWNSVLLSLLVIAVSITVLVVMFRRLVSAPLSGVIDAIQQLAAGNHDIEVPHLSKTDEIGTVARSLQVLRDAVAKAFTLGQMVEQTTANVMTVDVEGFTIDYANKTSRDTLKSLSHAVQHANDEIVGGSADILFADDAERMRKLLRDPANLPYSTNVTIGGEVLSISATPIYDRNGAYVVPMLNWSVITDQVKIAIQRGADPASDDGRGRRLGTVQRKHAKRRQFRGRAVEFNRRNFPSGRQVQRHLAKSSRENRKQQRENPEPGRRQPEDRRGRANDQRHRRPDQPAGIECDHRGGARRRGGQGLRRGCGRGQESRQPDRQGDRRNRATDRRHAGGNRRRGDDHPRYRRRDR